MKNLGTLAWWLVVIGALNWGLVVLGFNLVDSVGMWTTPMLATLIYALVGLSGIYVLLQHFEVV